MSNNKIALTASMRSNLLSLKNTQSLMNKTQDRLSSGYKVNSAMDNPSSYFTAQSLNSRANDLSTLLDGIGQAISTLEVADQGITTLQDFVEQAKSVANSARDTQNVAASTKSGTKFDPDTIRVTNLTNQISGVQGTDEFILRLGDATEMKGDKAASTDMQLSTLFAGATAFAVSSAGVPSGGSGSIKVGGQEYNFDFSANTANTMVKTTTFAVGDRLKVIDCSTITESKVMDSNGNLHIADLTGITGIAAGTSTELTCTAADQIVTTVQSTGSQGTTITAASWSATASGLGAFGNNTTQIGITIKNGGTVKEMIETITDFIGKDKLSMTVEDNNLVMKTLDTSSLEATGDFASTFGFDKGTKFTVTPGTDTAEALRQKIAAIDGVSAEFDTDGHIVVKSDNGDDMVISGKLAERLGLNGAVTNGSNERDAYAKQFNNLMGQIDQLVQDTSYKGTNLLQGDSLVVNFNESRTSSIELKGVNFNSSGLGFTAAANRWVDNASIDKSLEQITKATSMLRAQASEFGQNLSTVQIREDFTQNMINNLQSGADKLTLADMNEEGANMLALQTRQQLGVNSLSLASQASQSVLRLF